MGKSVAIVGPYFATSPYDAAAAKEGKLANGRSLDPTKEAVVKGTIAPSADNSLNYVVDGVAFAGDLNAYTANGDSKLTGSMFQTHVIKNCVFGGNSPYGIVRADCSATSNKVMDLTVKDCVFDGTNVTRTGSNALILARANFCNLENIAVINDTSKLESTNRLAYITLTDGSKLKWTAKRTYADANNITIYNSNRNVIIYTLRDTTTVNANYDYYPDGVELNVTNTYVTGGMGYLFGVQGGQATGSEEFIKLTATDNYYYRPDYTGNEVENYQTSGYTNIDIFTADSVMEDNVLISNEKFLAKAYGDDLNIDDNFFGKVVDGKVVASYVSSSSTGVVKNTKEYWINEEMTVKNTDLGLVDNGYKSIEMGDWKGYNQYAVDATNITATPSMFKAAEGAAIEGVYTDAACTTAATAFTHPQIVYVKVTKGDLSVVNAVKVDCVCAHDGTTTEQIIEAPTCTLSGSKGYVCEYCGDLGGEVTEIPKNGHTPSTELSVDTPATCQTPGVGHYNCTVCPEVAEANVEISVVDCVAADEKVIDRQPNCTDRGEAHTVCKWCGKTLESGLEVGVGDHIWNTEYSVIEEATCTQQGQEAITCSICGTIKTGSDVMTDPLPHPWNTEYTVDVEPTCQEDGSESIHCSVCGTQQEGSSRTIEKGQHVWGTTYTVDEEATCTDYGMESIHCTLCDASQEGSQRRTPKADHAWNTEYTVDVEPTCSEEGEQSIYCSVCDTLKEGSTVAIPTTPHNWDTEFTVDWFESCTEPGQQSKYCLDCGAQTEITAIPAAGHGEGEWVITVAPTYQTAGVETSFCEYCGEVLDTRVVAKLQGANAATVFVDVSEGDWFYKNDAVNVAYNTGVMNGTTTTTFSPDAPITRGMFITILGRLSGEDVSQYSIAETGFKDVSKTAYYADYIAWGYENGIINGYSATVFGPDKNITREQICKMLLEYCNYEGITAVATEKAVTFADASQISGYAKKYVKTCQRAGLVNGEKVGSKYYFRPQDTATRAEAATMIRNLCYTYMF